MRSLSVARGVAYQCTRKLIRLPPKLLPSLLLPLFMFAAFGGALGALGSTKGFGYYSYTAFVFVFVLYMASMFAAVFTTFDIAADFEGGFGNRMMLAAPRRLAIVGGYVIVALWRGLANIAVVFAVALATGMSVQGNAIDVIGLVALALLLNTVATLYGAGIALRFQSTASGVLILIPTFMLFFLSPIFIPRHQLSGWLRDAADVNPLTPVLEAGRGFLADDPVKVVLAFAALLGLALLFSVWVVRGMRKAERGPGSPARGPRARGPRARGPRARAQQGAEAKA
ncbi:MAG TPA: ABC transporter permease [Solirubrobacteraceae bacterium]|nr:ABC transporter permease [Solirubrobacteraceae bacterium]